MPWASRNKYIILVLLFLMFMPDAFATRIGDMGEVSFGEQIGRFVSLSDPSLRYALFGSVLLGITCGLLGCFIVIRRMALLGDTLSHAVLPGVAFAFLWAGTKDPVAIFIGSAIACLLGGFTVNVITHTTRIKEDTALGMVLATFFAVGICALTIIQRLPMGNKSGIDKFLFGQAAAIGRADIILMTGVAVLVMVLVVLFYKELVLVSFDKDFAKSISLPVKVLDYFLMILLTLSIVVALQAVGVVLVSAMLITPAAAAYLLTDRMKTMIIMSVIFGMLAGMVGAFLSFMGNNLPTGPFMVMGASIIFVYAFFFAPRHGVFMKWWREKFRGARTRRENTLKSIYHVLEAEGFRMEGITLAQLADKRRETIEESYAQVHELVRCRLATWGRDKSEVFLAPEGWKNACSIVRNHRLWELYLTNEANYATDHVHDDAEVIEHILGEDVVFQLEKRLAFPHFDPHGKSIPSLADLEKNKPQVVLPGDVPGYYKGTK